MHREVGSFAAQCGIESLICHGEHARFIYEGYISSDGVQAHYYPLMEELRAKIKKHIKKGDTILVKASRGMRFEALLPVISGSRQERKTV
jgi:UDP-N-acetylmuramoyl-tripeptide--D-alanyl-D-alanine ligase